MRSKLQEFIDKIQKIDKIEEFDENTKELSDWLLSQNYDVEIVNTIFEKSQYLKSSFSMIKTLENMEKAKNNLLLYLKTLETYDRADVDILDRYLQNFTIFMKNCFQTSVHKKATLNIEDLQRIQIRNEYDLQHILYAVLKPLFLDARTEVNEDTGYGTFRSDIKIPSLDAVIEIKCTRHGMSEKKLIEEISSDMINYTARFLYFFIYDKEGIIKDPQSLKDTYTKKMDEKYIKTIILHPVLL